MNNNLKCRDCKPPERKPGCHATCEAFIKWKKEYDLEQKRIKKIKWLNSLGKADYKSKK